VGRRGGRAKAALASWRIRGTTGSSSTMLVPGSTISTLCARFPVSRSFTFDFLFIVFSIVVIILLNKTY
jgi:hypothetical protein